MYWSPPALNAIRAELLKKMKTIKDSKTYKFVRQQQKEADLRFQANNN